MKLNKDFLKTLSVTHLINIIMDYELIEQNLKDSITSLQTDLINAKEKYERELVRQSKCLRCHNSDNGTPRRQINASSYPKCCKCVWEPSHHAKNIPVDDKWCMKTGKVDNFSTI